MQKDEQEVLGVDACPIGWLATVIGPDESRTETYRSFGALYHEYDDAKRILVDIPIGLPDGERRQCEQLAKDLLGCRGSSVFFPPCRSAAELSEHRAASDEHEKQIGHGLSQQAHNISDKILQVAEVVGNEYDGVIRESHPELCFAAINGQPIAYSKSSALGRGLRMKLLNDAYSQSERLYRSTRDEYLLKEVRRDDILDSIVLAITARDGPLSSVPEHPSIDEPRIYYPEFTVPTVEIG
ncbi:DUF429 domain-containing protein [Halomicroarcula sp. F28]|uniref:DUF429 domain-containing protein n=1 Tax=Haloarcula salinisoli TaxID=2487746 RepID=UPI001C735EC0|nr:DUF429 domain-containing protein [Halomicroarcula salinisoli]MBX0286602.1 DUF429 domain-containing protein [Halomicroarcula salinisoli]